MQDSALNKAVELIMQGGVVVLSGAGASTESGIADFRSKSGLWSRYDPMEYGTISAFRRDPMKVWGMLKELLDYIDAVPNAGHLGLAKLEKLGLLIGIITQNIDGLHQEAGSKQVVEFHGSPSSFSCLRCEMQYQLADLQGRLPPYCQCGEILKPDIVFFDERIPELAIVEAKRLIARAKTLLVVGTSCQVVPAAYFPETVRSRGGKIVEINLEPTLGHMADISLVGGFSKVVKKLLQEISKLNSS